MEFHNTANWPDPFLDQGLLGSNLQFRSMRLANSAASDLVLIMFAHVTQKDKLVNIISQHFQSAYLGDQFIVYAYFASN